jgi:hypothetical protein
MMQKLREDEAAAKVTLNEARASLGERHPSVVQARARLEAIEARVRTQEQAVAGQLGAARLPGQSFIEAEPIWMPSAPNPLAYLGLGAFGGLVGGIALALVLDRRNTGLRSARAAEAVAGIPCLGMMPAMAAEDTPGRLAIEREAFRALGLATGLAQRAASARAVLLTTPIPVAAKAAFVARLAGTLAEDGQRVLVVDFAPGSHQGVGVTLDDVISQPKMLRDVFEAERGQPVTELRRSALPDAAEHAFASFAAMAGPVDELMAVARAHFDIILIDTPPTLLYSDSCYLGRLADYSIVIAGWNETPAESVAEALRRLAGHGVRVDGLVLTSVDIDRYASFVVGDRIYYVGRLARQVGGGAQRWAAARLLGLTERGP